MLDSVGFSPPSTKSTRRLPATLREVSTWRRRKSSWSAWVGGHALVVGGERTAQVRSRTGPVNQHEGHRLGRHQDPARRGSRRRPTSRSPSITLARPERPEGRPWDARCRGPPPQQQGKNSQGLVAGEQPDQPVPGAGLAVGEGRAGGMLMSGSRSSWLGLVWWALCLGTHQPKLPDQQVGVSRPTRSLAGRDRKIGGAGVVADEGELGEHHRQVGGGDQLPPGVPTTAKATQPAASRARLRSILARTSHAALQQPSRLICRTAGVLAPARGCQHRSSPHRPFGIRSPPWGGGGSWERAVGGPPQVGSPRRTPAVGACRAGQVRADGGRSPAGPRRRPPRGRREAADADSGRRMTLSRRRLAACWSCSPRLSSRLVAGTAGSAANRSINPFTITWASRSTSGSRSRPAGQAAFCGCYRDGPCSDRGRGGPGGGASQGGRARRGWGGLGGSGGGGSGAWAWPGQVGGGGGAGGGRATAGAAPAGEGGGGGGGGAGQPARQGDGRGRAGGTSPAGEGGIRIRGGEMAVALADQEAQVVPELARGLGSRSPRTVTTASPSEAVVADCNSGAIAASSAGSWPGTRPVPPAKQPESLRRSGYWAATARTLVAWGPFWPWVMSNSTAWPSWSVPILDGAGVDEHVVAGLGLDEAVALVGVEPLDGSNSHAGCPSLRCLGGYRSRRRRGAGGKGTSSTVDKQSQP